MAPSAENPDFKPQTEDSVPGTLDAVLSEPSVAGTVPSDGQPSVAGTVPSDGQPSVTGILPSGGQPSVPALLDVEPKTLDENEVPTSEVVGSKTAAGFSVPQPGNPKDSFSKVPRSKASSYSSDPSDEQSDMLDAIPTANFEGSKVAGAHEHEPGTPTDDQGVALLENTSGGGEITPQISLPPTLATSIASSTDASVLGDQSMPRPPGFFIRTSNAMLRSLRILSWIKPLMVVVLAVVIAKITDFEPRKVLLVPVRTSSDRKLFEKLQKGVDFLKPLVEENRLPDVREIEADITNPKDAIHKQLHRAKFLEWAGLQKHTLVYPDSPHSRASLANASEHYKLLTSMSHKYGLPTLLLFDNVTCSSILPYLTGDGALPQKCTHDLGGVFHAYLQRHVTPHFDGKHEIGMVTEAEEAKAVVKYFGIVCPRCNDTQEHRLPLDELRKIFWEFPISILVVGHTGAGKSTFIYWLLHHNEKKEKADFISSSGTTGSHTRAHRYYKDVCKGNNRVIVDSPGYPSWNTPGLVRKVMDLRDGFIDPECQTTWSTSPSETHWFWSSSSSKSPCAHPTKRPDFASDIVLFTIAYPDTEEGFDDIHNFMDQWSDSLNDAVVALTHVDHQDCHKHSVDYCVNKFAERTAMAPHNIVAVPASRQNSGQKDSRVYLSPQTVLTVYDKIREVHEAKQLRS